MSKRKIVIVVFILIAITTSFVVFGNNVLIHIDTDSYIKLSFLKTYSNVTKKNKSLFAAYNVLDGKPLNIEAFAETVNTNISFFGFKIKNVLLNTDFVWYGEETFSAENKLRLGIFTLASIDIFGNENEIAVYAPKVFDKYVVIDKDKLIGEMFNGDDKRLAEIMVETVRLFAGSTFSYMGRETKNFAGIDMDLYKIKANLLKKDVDLYLQKVNTLDSLPYINVTEDVFMYLYTNKKHEIVAFEIENIEGLPLDVNVKFALYGEKWLLSDFAYDIEIFGGNNIQVQARGCIGLNENNKIALTMEPINILTDFVKTNTEIEARLSVVLSEADKTEIAFPTGDSIKYEDLQKDKLYKILDGAAKELIGSKP